MVEITTADMVRAAVNTVLEMAAAVAPAYFIARGPGWVRKCLHTAERRRLLGPTRTLAATACTHLV